MSIDPSTTAVVLIEYQNDFTSDGGVLHPAVTGGGKPPGPRFPDASSRALS
ncbi:MAG: hypothetical protein ACT4NY_28195 [Pseudonocardiales bacterium]